MRKAREANEKLRMEESFVAAKNTAMELSVMETEEKNTWDTYELPYRNRLRLVAENEAKIAEGRRAHKAKKATDKLAKEEGVSSFNGTIQDFSRWKDSPALFHSFVGHAGEVLGFRLTSDYNYVVSCGADATVRLWDMHSMRCVRVYEGHGKAVRDCDVISTFGRNSPSGGILVSCSADKTVRIWDAVLGTCKKTMRGHTDVVYTCSFTPDGGRIVSGSADRTVRLWDSAEGHLIYVFRGHESGVLSTAFSPTGKYLVSSSDYGERSIRMWYTDMPYMVAKQTVGIRIHWETTGVMRRLTVKYEPKPGFYTDKEGARTEMDEEDEADAAWLAEHPDGVDLSAGAGDEDDEKNEELRREEEKAREEERNAIDLPDVPEKHGFSISVNSVDRFGRFSQVNSYYPGVELSVVLRGVEPFNMFFVSVYYKKAQFDAFDEKSGVRVGKFVAETKLDGTFMDNEELAATCEMCAVSSKSPGMATGVNELSLTWKAPTLLERAMPGADVPSGFIVVKAAMARDPLTLEPDEEDVGLVQVSYTLKEVDVPKKGSLLTEISAGLDKAEKNYGSVDVVANHQLFIEFLRNRDVTSVGTLLSERVHLMLGDEREVTGPDKVLEVLEDMMMLEGQSVIVKDAKLLCNGVTYNTVERDQANDKKADTAAAGTGKKKGGEESAGGEAASGGGERGEEGGGEAGSLEGGTAPVDDEEEESSSDEDEENGPSDRALRRALIASAAPGPAEWSGGPVRLRLRPLELLAGRKPLHPKSTLEKLGLAKRVSNKAAGGGDGGSDAGGDAKKLERPVKRTPGALAAVSLRARAEAEVKAILTLRREHPRVAEEMRIEHLPGRGYVRLETAEQEEDELVHKGRFGVGHEHLRMSLPPIYPKSALAANAATINARKGRLTSVKMKQDEARAASRVMPAEYTPEETEAMVEEMMAAMMEADAKLKVAAGERRTTIERLPAFEDLAKDLGTSVKVKDYELGRTPGAALSPLRKVKAAALTEQPGEAAGEAEAAGENGYDQTRRRNAYPTLPGFNGKPPKGADLEALELAAARAFGGLIRCFTVEGFHGGDDIKVHHNGINQVTFNAVENRVASASGDKTVRLWDTRSGTLVNTLAGHEEAVLTVAFSAEGSRLLSSGLDNYILIWNAASGVALRRLYGHDDAVRKVVFFNESTAIASCSADHTVKVWYLTPQPPAAPARPLVTDQTGHSLTVRWVAPSAFNEDVTAYHIQYRVGIREDFGKDLSTTGAERSRVVTGLTAGTPYQFRVRAVNRMGFGAWSEASAQTHTEIDVPDALERPEVVEVTAFAIGIKWRAPTASLEGTSITKFVVQLAGAGVSYEDRVQRVVTWAEGKRGLADHEHEVARRPPHHTVGQNEDPNLYVILEQQAKRERYQRRMLEKEAEFRRAEELAAQRARWEKGDFSDPKEAKRKRREARRRRREERAAREAEAESELGAAADGSVRGSIVGSDRSSVAGSARGSIVGSDRGSVAGSVAGSDRESIVGRASVHFEKGAAEAGALVPAPEPRSSMTGGEVVAAEAGGAAEEGPGAESEKPKGRLKQNLVEHYFLYDGLRPGFLYRLRVAGVSSVGQGKWSATTFSTPTLSTEPGRPHPPTVPPESVGMFGMRVEWVSPIANGSSITHFALRLCHDGTERLVEKNHVFLDLDGFDPGKPYSFMVRAKNLMGFGPWSDPSDPVYTATSSAEQPDPPAACDPTGIDFIDLDVRRPFANGCPVVGFLLQVREIAMGRQTSFGGDRTIAIPSFEELEQDRLDALVPSWGDAADDADDGAGAEEKEGEESVADPNVCRLRAVGLLADKTYDFRVAALNEHGASEWSLPSKRARTQPPLRPAAVKELRPDEVYPTACVFSWQMPKFHGAPIEDYKIEQQRTARPPGEQELDEDAAGEAGALEEGSAAAARAAEANRDLHVFHTLGRGDVLNRRVDDLVAGSTYRFRVAAINSVGIGKYSPWTSEITVTDECCGDPWEG